MNGEPPNGEPEYSSMNGKMPVIDVEDLVGMTFNRPDANDKEEKMEIVEALRNHENNLMRDLSLIHI